MSRIVDIDNRKDLIDAMVTLFTDCHFKHTSGCLAASCKDCLNRFFEESHSHLLPTIDVNTQNTINKQTPKKCHRYFYDSSKYICPNCLQHEDKSANYCRACGQALEFE